MSKEFLKHVKKFISGFFKHIIQFISFMISGLMFIGVLLFATVILYNFLGNLYYNYQYGDQSTLSGFVDDKSIKRSQPDSLLGFENTEYTVTIDDKSYYMSENQWNEISPDDEVEYKENKKSAGYIMI